MDPTQMIVSAVISGVIGGVITGLAALAAVRVELRWLRRDVDDLRDRMGLERRKALKG
jgi:hypothetical protein